MGKTFSVLKFIGNSLCNPVLWVTLLAPLFVYWALRLGQADITVSANGGPAIHLIPDDVESLIRSVHTKTILDYALQVFTVVLAFVFWIAGLFGDGLFKDAGEYLSVKDDGELTSQGRNALNKSLVYFVTAILIIAAVFFLFSRAGHIDVIRLYEPYAVVPHSWFTNWFFVSWNKIDGPPWSSPLTHIRFLLTIHGSFRYSYQQWRKLIGW